MKQAQIDKRKLNGEGLNEIDFWRFRWVNGERGTVGGLQTMITKWSYYDW